MGSATPCRRRRHGRTRTAAPGRSIAPSGWPSAYCASHLRYFWGLRLHLVCTPAGLPITFALADAKADEHEIIRDLVEVELDLVRPGQVILADEGYAPAQSETFWVECGATLIRPAKAGEPPRPGARFSKPLRRMIESINDTLKGRSTWSDTGTHPRGCGDAGDPAHPGHDRCHLAQPSLRSRSRSLPHRHDHD